MSNNNNGTNTAGLLGIAFIVLKLTNVIDWSWWYVTLPFWGGAVILLLIAGGYLLYEYIIDLIKK